MPATPGSPRSILAQHAETTRLLGVDMMPVRPVQVDHTAAHKPPTHEPAAHRPAAHEPQAKQTRPVEPTPSESAPVTTSSSDQQSQLSELRERYEREAPHAAFGYRYNNIVFGEGDPNARLMFIGEAPGADEDASGRPFVGRAGQLLDKMIIAMGLAREQVYIANILKIRPTDNATPTVSDREASWPYLREQIQIVAPSIIVTLGLPSTHTVLETTGSMASLRSRFHEYNCLSGRTISVMPTYHPAYLLRSYTQENRAKVWSDLKQVVDALG